jgi:hypothetical protein
VLKIGGSGLARLRDGDSAMATADMVRPIVRVTVQEKAKSGESSKKIPFLHIFSEI